MPNYCSNQLLVRAENEEALQDFVSTLKYIGAFQDRSAIRVLVMHCWYHLIFAADDTEKIRYVDNQYARILEMTNDAFLSEEICMEIEQIFLDQNLTVQTIGEAQCNPKTRQSLRNICTEISIDFLGPVTNQEVPLWDQIVNLAHEKVTLSTDKGFDFGSYLPPKLAPSVNGFNGCFFRALQTEIGEKLPIVSSERGKSHYRQRWGTKWNACDVTIETTVSTVVIDFYTAWSPPTPVIEKIGSDFSSLTIIHIFAEQGMDYCGTTAYSKGSLLLNTQRNLEWSEPKNEGDEPQVIGPKFILKLRDYGG